jgi:hypothetical protein
MRNYPEIGVQVGEILLPNESVDRKKWAVIACDQFTSEPEYWENVQNVVGEAPSTLKMILPEVFLGTPAEQERIQKSREFMAQYLADDIFNRHNGLILVEREVDGKTRRGLMLALDLEHYDFSQGSQSLIRATEGTIIDRLPPRIRIRQDAPLEIPHILVLIDDPERKVIDPLVEIRQSLRLLYETELMQGSGILRGFAIDDLDMERLVMQALNSLASRERFEKLYAVGSDKEVLLFAVGDGNHSLATAKSIWEKIKPTVGMDHPARYALVEVENVHDEGLEFEPIHRVLFGLQGNWKSALETYFQNQVPEVRLRFSPCASPAEMMTQVNHQEETAQKIGVITSEGAQVVWVENPPSNLAVGTLQSFLDNWLKQGGAAHIDYVHGGDVLCRLGAQPGNAGFYLPAMNKNQLFKTVILDGSLPRKTFSMGEAHQKRFYMECRRIS